MNNQLLPAPLNDSDLAHLRALLLRYSTERVAKHLGVSRHLALSAAAGLFLEPRHAKRVHEALRGARLEP